MRKTLLGVLLCIVLGLAASGLAFAAGKTASPSAVMIIAANNFQDDEFAVPKGILEKNGIKVTVASTTLSEITGMNGAKAKADILLKDVRIADYDAVIFIGGSGAVQYLDDSLAHRLAQDAMSTDKIVGAICIAPRILGNAGVLKGKRATVYPSEKDNLSSCGVNYTGKGTERDGNIITADGPGSAKEFGEEIVKALLKR